MYDFFLKICSLSLLALMVIFVVKWLLNKKGKNVEGLIKARNFFVGIMIFSIAGGVITSPSQKESPAIQPKKVETRVITKTTEENKISTPAQNTPKILDLGLSPFAFSQQFNQNSQSIAPEIGFYVNEPQIQIGEKQNVFQYNFTGNLGMLGIVDKSNGNVKEIMIISTPKTADDILGGVLLYGISIMTVSPQLTVDQRSTILNELQLSNPESTDFLHLDRKITYGNYIYSAKFVQNIGLHYSISPKDLN